MPDPLISVVTPSFQQGRFLRATLDSVLTQDYRNVEVLVTDGGSTDETLDVLRSYADPRLRWVSEADRGQTHAINKGMQQARGEILSYLNSDDVLEPGILSLVARHFDDHPDAAMVYGDNHRIDTSGRNLQQPIYGQPYDLVRYVTKRQKISQPGTFWRREVMARIGLFDETFPYLMDKDYFFRVGLAGFRVDYLPLFTASFRLHEQSKTISQEPKQWQEWYQFLDKVYAMPDLPARVKVVRQEAYDSIDLYGVSLWLRLGDVTQARRLSRKLMATGMPRLRALAALRWLESYLPPPLDKLPRATYYFFARDIYFGRKPI